MERHKGSSSRPLRADHGVDTRREATGEGSADAASSRNPAQVRRPQRTSPQPGRAGTSPRHATSPRGQRSTSRPQLVGSAGRGSGSLAGAGDRSPLGNRRGTPSPASEEVRQIAYGTRQLGTRAGAPAPSSGRRTRRVSGPAAGAGSGAQAGAAPTTGSSTVLHRAGRAARPTTGARSFRRGRKVLAHAAGGGSHTAGATTVPGVASVSARGPAPSPGSAAAAEAGDDEEKAPTPRDVHFLQFGIQNAPAGYGGAQVPVLTVRSPVAAGGEDDDFGPQSGDTHDSPTHTASAGSRKAPGSAPPGTHPDRGRIHSPGGRIPERGLAGDPVAAAVATQRGGSAELASEGSDERWPAPALHSTAQAVASVDDAGTMVPGAGSGGSAVAGPGGVEETSAGRGEGMATGSQQPTHRRCKSDSASRRDAAGPQQGSQRGRGRAEGVAAPVPGSQGRGRGNGPTSALHAALTTSHGPYRLPGAFGEGAGDAAAEGEEEAGTSQAGRDLHAMVGVTPISAVLSASGPAPTSLPATTTGMAPVTASAAAIPAGASAGGGDWWLGHAPHAGARISPSSGDASWSGASSAPERGLALGLGVDSEGGRYVWDPWPPYTAPAPAPAPGVDRVEAVQAPDAPGARLVGRSLPREPADGRQPRSSRGEARTHSLYTNVGAGAAAALVADSAGGAAGYAGPRALEAMPTGREIGGQHTSTGRVRGASSSSVYSSQVDGSAAMPEARTSPMSAGEAVVPAERSGSAPALASGPGADPGHSLSMGASAPCDAVGASSASPGSALHRGTIEEEEGEEGDGMGGTPPQAVASAGAGASGGSPEEDRSSREALSLPSAGLGRHVQSSAQATPADEPHTMLRPTSIDDEQGGAGAAAGAVAPSVVVSAVRAAVQRHELSSTEILELQSLIDAAKKGHGDGGDGGEALEALNAAAGYVGGSGAEPSLGASSSFSASVHRRANGAEGDGGGPAGSGAMQHEASVQAQGLITLAASPWTPARGIVGGTGGGDGAVPTRGEVERAQQAIRDRMSGYAQGSAGGDARVIGPGAVSATSNSGASPQRERSTSTSGSDGRASAEIAALYARSRRPITPGSEGGPTLVGFGHGGNRPRGYSGAGAAAGSSFALGLGSRRSGGGVMGGEAPSSAQRARAGSGFVEAHSSTRDIVGSGVALDSAAGAAAGGLRRPRHGSHHVETQGRPQSIAERDDDSGGDGADKGHGFVAGSGGSGGGGSRCSSRCSKRSYSSSSSSSSSSKAGAAAGVYGRRGGDGQLHLSAVLGGGSAVLESRPTSEAATRPCGADIGVMFQSRHNSGAERDSASAHDRPLPDGPSPHENGRVGQGARSASGLGAEGAGVRSVFAAPSYSGPAEGATAGAAGLGADAGPVGGEAAVLWPGGTAGGPQGQGQAAAAAGPVPLPRSAFSPRTGV